MSRIPGTGDELDELITDKSICQRGHPRACIVVVSADDDVGKDAVTSHYECSACTQLEAELKPLKDALETLRCFHGEPASVFEERYPMLAQEFHAEEEGQASLARVAQEALRKEGEG